MTRNLVRALFAALAGLLASAAGAHEFWLLPDRFDVKPGERVQLRMFVGENFSGDLVGFSSAAVASLHHYHRDSAASLGAAMPQVPAGEFAVRLAGRGTHLLALDTNPVQIVLPPDKFLSYLRDEGLDHIIRMREAAGTASTPGRERYRRHVKAIVNAGAVDTKTVSRVTSQRIEIIPLPGAFEVRFDGKPLPGALLKLWHHGAGGLQVVRRLTDAKGRAGFEPPTGGTWMASVVHMIAAKDSPEVDWDSFWGNLTFAVPPR